MTEMDCRFYQWNVDSMPPDQIAFARSELHRLIRLAIPSCPENPGPHGKFRNVIWNCFPSESVAGDEWFDILNSVETWIAVPESANDSPFLLRKPFNIPEDLPLPRTDLYLWSRELPDQVLAIDHEDMGPWWIRPGLPVEQIISEDSPAFSVNGHPIGKGEFIGLVDWLKCELAKRDIYTPAYPLEKWGPYADHLWNYLPRSFDVAVHRDSLVGQFLRSQSSVLFWTDAVDEAWVISQNEIETCLLQPNSYFLDFPDRRWLLAIPDSYLKNPKDPDLHPSFLVFS